MGAYIDDGVVSRAVLLLGLCRNYPTILPHPFLKTSQVLEFKGWRCAESSASHALHEFPANREIYREFKRFMRPTSHDEPSQTPVPYGFQGF